MRLVNIDDCNRALFYKQCGGKDSLITVESAFNMFEALPTAYDIDKVVEELEKSSKWVNETNEYCDDDGNDYIPLSKAIEIVKQGGVSDDVCEWNQIKCGVGLKTYKISCFGKTLEMPVSTARGLKYCPYCGKKIRIVGD